MDFSPSAQPEFLALREKTLINAAAGLSGSERLILRLLLARRRTPVARSEISLATIGLFDDGATFQLSEAIEHINASLRAAGVSETIVLNADGCARLVN